MVAVRNGGVLMQEEMIDDLLPVDHSHQLRPMPLLKLLAREIIQNCGPSSPLPNLRLSGFGHGTGWITTGKKRTLQFERE
jgi:hypothetical protein